MVSASCYHLVISWRFSIQLNSEVHYSVKHVESLDIDSSFVKFLDLYVDTLSIRIFLRITIFHFYLFFSESKLIPSKDKSATISNATPPPQKVCWVNFHSYDCFNFWYYFFFRIFIFKSHFGSMGLFGVKLSSCDVNIQHKHFIGFSNWWF